jgi:hypothetical protein
MKYLITICITAIIIAFFFVTDWNYNTHIREEGRMRVAMFRNYARHHQRDAGPGDQKPRPGPTVETPTEHKEAFNLNKL